MIAAVLSGCEGGIFGGSSSSQADSATETQAQPAIEAETAPEETEKPLTLPTEFDLDSIVMEEVSGNGDNASLPLSVTLFDAEYTIGESTVQDLFDQDWGKDPEAWKKIDLSVPVESGEVGGSYLTIDKTTTEAYISFINLSDEPAVPAKCALSMIDFKGSTEGGLKKAGVKCLGSKLTLADITSPEKMEMELSAICSSYKKGKVKLPGYSFYYYVVELDGGKVRFDVTVKNDSQEITSINVKAAM